MLSTGADITERHGAKICRDEIVAGAFAWAKAGCVVHPAKADGSKQPQAVEGGSSSLSQDGSPDWGWGRIAHGQLAPMPLADVARGIGRGRWDGFGIFCGKVSGGLEMLEVEVRAAGRLGEVRAFADALGATRLFATLASCCEESASGGLHFIYRISDAAVPGNTKIACEVNADGVELVLAETRGQGGWFVAAPSAGRTHRSGQRYRFVTGSPTTIPTFTKDERDLLHTCFAVLDARPEPKPTDGQAATVRPRAEGDPLRPGDDFNERGTWSEILLPAGWQLVNSRGVREFWRRPGKREGVSATAGETAFCCFSTSAGLPTFDSISGKNALSRFGLFAHLHHAGDFASAARELGQRGYGEPARAITTISSSRQPEKVVAQDDPLLSQQPENIILADDEHDFEIVPSGSEDEPCDDVAEEDIWKPFPVELLPAVVGEYVGEAAASIGGDPSMIALPMLSSLAAAIGNTYAVELKRNWHEPAIVWSMVVGESGSSKSPCFRAALSFANDLDAENAPRNADARAGHHDELQRHKAALSAWQAQAKKSPGDAGDPPREPEPPADIAYTVSDATIEALIHKLASNPRGLLLARDELSGWLAGFDRYSSGSGKVSGDAAQWLELHNAGRVVVDRRHAGRIEVQKAAVSVAGGIQPRTLIKALGGEHVDNGLLARFVLAMPPQSPLAWSEDEPSIFVVQSMRDLLASLYAIPFTGSPKVCTLTAEGKAAWVQFFNEHQQAKAAERGPVASMMAKAEATAARLALICHLVRNATVAPVLQDEIDTDDLERGIGLARWFAHEWRRVYRALVGPDVGGSDVGGDDPRSLVEWLEDRGGDMPVRTIYKSGPRRYRDRAEQVERLVGQLVRAGRVESYSRPSDAGGQPARWVRLPR